MDLYIYYRVRVVDTAAFLTEIRQIQDNLALRHGVRSALKRRPEAQDGMHTWMEVYPDVADNFAALLEQTIMASQLSSLIDGKRHTEQFMDYSLCV